MTIPEHIFKSYDIRGIYPDEINEENIVTIIQAVYAFFSQKLNKDTITVALGLDMRTSSPKLFEAAKNTLIDCGAQVVDVGLVSTPTFYFAVSHYGYETGIQITASHNPKEYNGVKFVINTPTGLIKIGKPTGMEEVKRMALEGVKVQVPGGTIVKKEGIADEEAENALAVFNHPQLKKFKIVADPANAMGIQYIEALFKKVPADLIKMNFTLDGTFPSHQPDPLQFSLLADLQKRVVEEGADFGLAPDGDGDRLFFIDEKGQVVPATIITALVAREFLKEHPGETILFDIRNVLTPRKIIEENGGKYEITKVGHAFITEQLTKSGGIFAGESSGHFFYRATGNAESQVITMIAVMKVLTEENKKLSEIVTELSRCSESGEINFKVTNASEILEAVKQKYADGKLSTLDGIAIDYPDWRLSVRTSNTEPLLRLNVEADTKEVMEQKRDELVALINATKK